MNARYICGIYAPQVKPHLVRLCLGGRWVILPLDDFFPCHIDGGPIYARNRGSEIWVMLLQKAFAKAAGSYAAIENGL